MSAKPSGKPLTYSPVTSPIPPPLAPFVRILGVNQAYAQNAPNKLKIQALRSFEVLRFTPKFRPKSDKLGLCTNPPTLLVSVLDNPWGEVYLPLPPPLGLFGRNLGDF